MSVCVYIYMYIYIYILLGNYLSIYLLHMYYVRNIKLPQVGLKLAWLLKTRDKFVCFYVNSCVDVDCVRSSLSVRFPSSVIYSLSIYICNIYIYIIYIYIYIYIKQ